MMKTPPVPFSLISSGFLSGVSPKFTMVSLSARSCNRVDLRPRYREDFGNVGLGEGETAVVVLTNGGQTAVAVSAINWQWVVVYCLRSALAPDYSGGTERVGKRDVFSERHGMDARNGNVCQ